MNALPYSSTLVLGLHTVELIEHDLVDDEAVRILEARVDGSPVGELRLLASIFPSFAATIDSSPDLVIWTEAEIYLIAIADKQLWAYDHSDAIHEAYCLGEHWCLVGDASVAIVDIRRAVELSRYDHDEIITDSRWENASLIVTDLQGRKFLFDRLELAQGSPTCRAVLRKNGFLS